MTHWVCHNRDQSIQSGTDRCRTLPAASTNLRFCRARNHTSVQDSSRERKRNNVISFVHGGKAPEHNQPDQRLVSPYLAIDSRVAMRTGALVSPVTVEAGAPIEARPRVAFVDVILAVAAGEAGKTQARECIDAIHTGAAVEAGAEETHNHKICMMRLPCFWFFSLNTTVDIFDSLTCRCSRWC